MQARYRPPSPLLLCTSLGAFLCPQHGGDGGNPGNHTTVTHSQLMHAIGKSCDAFNLHLCAPICHARPTAEVASASGSGQCPIAADEGELSADVDEDLEDAAGRLQGACGRVQ